MGTGTFTFSVKASVVKISEPLGSWHPDFLLPTDRRAWGGRVESQVWVTFPKASSFKGRGEAGWGRGRGEEEGVGPQAQWGLRFHWGLPIHGFIGGFTEYV